MLPRLTRAANHSKLYLGLSAALAGAGGRFGRRAATRGLGSIAISSAVVNLVIKPVVHRRRPQLAWVPAPRRLAKQLRTTSFPSGHSSSAAAFAVGASLEMPWLALPLGAIATGVCVSRVYTGAHYPFDVLVGAAIGAGTAAWTPRRWPLAPHGASDVAARRDWVELEPRPHGEGVVLVLNRGGGEAGAGEDALRRALPAAEIVAVDDGDDLVPALDAAAARAEVLGVYGGDGSANAAAAAALDHDRPLLLVPGGTLNHLARDLTLGEGHEAALGALARGEAIRMDVAEIDGRPFLNTASFGSYPELVHQRERLEHRLGKWPALAVALVRVLQRGAVIRCEVDGEPRRLWMAFIGNGRYEPAGFAPAWRERLDEGVLDVRLIDASQPFARTRLLGALLLGRLAGTEAYDARITERLELQLPQDPRLARDGEVFEGGAHVVVQARADRLVVYAPRG